MSGSAWPRDWRRQMPSQAAAIYQAIIDLHQGDTWAEAIVAKARSRMAELKK